MNVLERLAQGDVRSSELSRKIAGEVLENPQLLKEVASGLSSDNRIVRSGAAEVFAESTVEHPEIGAPFISELIEVLRFPEAQTRWEAMKALGNISTFSPQEAEQAFSKVAKNLDDESLCVRESAIFFLGKLGATSAKQARKVYPYLHQAHQNCRGSELGRLIESFGLVGAMDADLAKKVNFILRPYLQHTKPSIRTKAKRALIKVIKPLSQRRRSKRQS